MNSDFASKDASVHTHDRNMSLNKAIGIGIILKKCNERRHATKPVTQGIKAISTGAKKNVGKTCHPQLTDKGARFRNHVYYVIDSFKGDGIQLRNKIDSCILQIRITTQTAHHCPPVKTRDTFQST